MKITFPYISHYVSHTPNLARLLTILLLLFCSTNLFAQRLAVHAIKDFSTDSNANKAWGVGGNIELDQLVKKMTFKGYFDWATYKDKDNPIHPNYQRMGGGITVCYSIDIAKKLTFQCGADINYTHVKHSYIHKYDYIDSITSRPLTLLQKGNFIGIGPHIGCLYKITPRFNVTLNVTPSYLISVGGKSSVDAIEPEYNKGIWLFPIRLGLSYQIFKNE